MLPSETAAAIGKKTVIVTDKRGRTIVVSILAGGGFFTSAALLRDVPMAQPVDAGGASEPVANALGTMVEGYIFELIGS